MRDSFCFVVFSHADTPEKDQILNESLNSIKDIGIKIILASHIPVSERNQNLCDYFMKDNDNLILSESDIFSSPTDILEDTFCAIDYIGGITTETSVFKKTYQAGVLNLYIGAFKLAKQVGFENAILWEHDYLLGKNSKEFIYKNMDLMLDNKLESVFFGSAIKIFENDIIRKEIKCCYPVPSFFNLDKFLSLIPNHSIKNSNEFTKTTNLMLIEQWVKKQITDNCTLKIEYPYSEYLNYLPDTISGRINSQNQDYLYIGLRSGIYFDRNKPIVIFNNCSDSHLNIVVSIYGDLGDILFEERSDLYPGNWRYSFLEEEISNKFNSLEGCKIKEEVISVDTGKVDILEYIINRNNIEFLSKLKKYSKDDQKNN
jgi:hypothetical protein